MILAHYQTLYDSSVAFGMRKALQSSRDKDSMHCRINSLEKHNRDLESEIEQLDAHYEAIVKRDAESDICEKQEHVHLAQELKKAN
mmetsp:Transcript_7268/g.10216  ORF Transcript_7268/g.10216 Transcript_7268/m.10216 type:complete len:86 (+) Transcript_7268:443-700(+)|eukprot:CAMPEP_0185585240 /NCGR_PEP_ID=MMETSP0434-20130131/37496_1 /TAXON_ID=626734 ORGANISM="Favella taraikaensis, Strain Fe Narragansett Bay" /NCGR_SAMPLE_ID=MMETSP0434 /ASSEMBLY_ACC=CAM_ASM_000379 /LENGTH=85 /DNA_ID=CAMNT_0028205451 /DNA_START=389 /DNA_END=646 /DNA_ORIENTATION=+